MLHCERCGCNLNDPHPRCLECGKLNSFHVMLGLGLLLLAEEFLCGMLFQCTFLCLFPLPVTLAILVTGLVTLLGAVIHQVWVEKAAHAGVYRARPPRPEPAWEAIPLADLRIRAHHQANRWLESLASLRIELNRLRFGGVLSDYLARVDGPGQTRLPLRPDPLTVACVALGTLPTMVICSTFLSWSHGGETSFLGMIAWSLVVYAASFSLLHWLREGQGGPLLPLATHEEANSKLLHRPLSPERIRSLERVHPWREEEARLCRRACHEYNRLVERVALSVRHLFLDGNRNLEPTLSQLIPRLNEQRRLLVRRSEVLASRLDGETRGISGSGPDQMNQAWLDAEHSASELDDLVRNLLDEAEISLRVLNRLSAG